MLHDVCLHVCLRACALLQARHSDNVPKVEPFAIPIRSLGDTGFKGVTKATSCYQARAWKAGRGITLDSSPHSACIPRLAVRWAQHQLDNYPDKYKTHFQEEWMRLWLDDLADISTSTTSEDIIKFWGGEAAQVCRYGSGIDCNPECSGIATSLPFGHRRHHQQQHHQQ